MPKAFPPESRRDAVAVARAGETPIAKDPHTRPELLNPASQSNPGRYAGKAGRRQG